MRTYLTIPNEPKIVIKVEIGGDARITYKNGNTAVSLRGEKGWHTSNYSTEDNPFHEVLDYVLFDMSPPYDYTKRIQLRDWMLANMLPNGPRTTP